MRVVDSHMQDIPKDGETMGEVIMRGNNVMTGYYSDSDATAKAFEGEWFHSGDLAVWHPTGSSSSRTAPRTSSSQAERTYRRRRSRR